MATFVNIVNHAEITALVHQLLPPIMFQHSNVSVLPRVTMVTGVKINVQKICQLRSLKCWPVYKYEIFLNYTSTLQKKATHL
ncbi:hypothetical protein BgiBS90_005320 [Biomphalaria glabrata]|nr:hypothetical protein BgiBS90_005320 [Biomphalaria glabrata]